MKRIGADPKVLTCILVEDFLQDLQDISRKLDESQKILFSILERKRRDFPRFYFLANNDLFNLLGNSKDPLRVNKHIKKYFEGIARLNIHETIVPIKQNVDVHIHDVIELISLEEEVVKLCEKVICENGVESWIKNVERTMR
jgi:dynein heavy chain